MRPPLTPRRLQRAPLAASAVGVVMTAGLLTACGSNDSPAIVPRSTTTISPSHTPTSPPARSGY